MVILYKEKAVFCEENSERIKNIIKSRRDPKKLAIISPSFISMDLTWGCNYNCLGCLEECVNKENNNLPLEIIEDIFTYSNKHKIRGIMVIGGEPFLYEKGIKKTLEKSIEYQIPLKIVTNGSHLGKNLDLIINAFQIPSSRLRVSINSNIENYKKQIGNKNNLKKILKDIKNITSKGIPLVISTVVFPEESIKDKTIPNVDQIKEIIKYCQKSGVKEYILLPARDPKTKKRYHRSKRDKDKLWEIRRNKYENLRIKMDDILCVGKTPVKNKNFFCCPSSFLTTLIGPNKKIYKCTDSRGKESMVIGKIEKPGDFEKFWHSEERVKKQLKTKCPNGGCGRGKINSIMNSSCETFMKYNIDLSDYLIQKQEEKAIFI